ncbi:aminotransferase class III-fold pyridoxal phosphate-dependent enzyme [Sphaerisporangium sp. TRM90804]|uniref:aminotransferase class III-fold pyridoxal phosphate-dependent enzyme n=1 Tax=Sphaerisporangium sp. TRM90804 TaxID=3031113 RepID=UPI0024495286|nr:aminotransferase class III-fold pyridoxal phosphate-dependent enzyme [Sphaerisporangium sp. TRM90804]MDH2430799.1 aminotransferase class III-fold pyridoxal phosphate-dependent enzyme [Sphaerisporangium sp. TRM90804]
MTTPTPYSDWFLTALLAVSRMDVVYTRAKGGTLYHRDENGAEVAALDLVGGWGALLLGHNPPEIVARAKEFLDADSPVHAQLSVAAAADELSGLLNDVLRREFPGVERYAVTYANSGAEAIEVALKHAELDRLLRVKALFEEIEWNIGAAVAAVGGGEAELPDTMPGGHEPPADVEALVASLTALAGGNLAHLARPPVFFALEGAFHGKLTGAVQFTHNPLYRAAFQTLGPAVKFVPAGDPEAVERIVAEERATVFDVAVVDGRVRVVERDFPIFAGFLVEPIQGEGGIRPLTEDYARHLRRICDEISCPIIVDEIQSGMGRTGAFFAGSHIGLRGDYYTLGKSLGGGVAKVSATLVRDSLYRPEFGLMHSSTFAKDGFSTAVALATLRLLEADGGQAYRVAAERGERIIGVLNGLAARFPDVIKEVRGRGLLIGLEFADQSAAPSAIVRDKARSGTLSYTLASYLLHVHGIRIGPTASDPGVLRIEPSILISDDDIERLERGVEQLCLILRASDALHLVHPLTRPGSVKPRAEIREFRAAAQAPADGGRAEQAGPPARKAAFVTYLTEPGLLRELDPSLAELGDDDLEAYVRRHEPLKATTPLPAVRVDTSEGASVDLTVYPLLATAGQMNGYLAAGQAGAVLPDIQARVLAAREDGCEVAGLGFAIGALSGHGAALRVPRITLTSGTALTVASAMNALESAARERFGGLDGLTLAVAGGGGRVGSVCAALGAERVSKIILLGSGRDGSAGRLRATAHRVYQDAWSLIAEGGAVAGIPALLSKEPLIDEWMREKRDASVPSGELIAAYLEERYGGDPFVVLTDDPFAVREAELVVSAAPGLGPVLTGEHLADGTVVCDVAGSGALSPGLRALRDDLRFVLGGVLSAPDGAGMPPGARGSLGEGRMSAAAVEAVVLALAGSGHAGGPLTGARVREIAELAERHGFRQVV